MSKWYRQNFWVTCFFTHMRTCTCTRTHTGVASYPVSICYDTRPEATRHTVESAQTQIQKIKNRGNTIRNKTYQCDTGVVKNQQGFMERLMRCNDHQVSSALGPQGARPRPLPHTHCRKRGQDSIILKMDEKKPLTVYIYTISYTVLFMTGRGIIVITKSLVLKKLKKLFVAPPE